MKRTLTACLLLAGLTLSLLLAFPTPASARETRTILKNGDFSASEKYWNLDAGSCKRKKASLSRTEASDGSAGMKITNSQAVASSLGQFANCRQGKTYIMSCDVRTENVTGGTGFCLGLATYDSQGYQPRRAGQLLGVRHTDWQTVTFFHNHQQSRLKVNVGARLWFSTGTAYVDNITLKEIIEMPSVSSTYDLTLSENRQSPYGQCTGVRVGPQAAAARQP